MYRHSQIALAANSHFLENVTNLANAPLRDPIGKMMDVVLAFTGIKLKHKYYFGSVILLPEKKREKWREKAFRIGRREARI